MVMERHPSPWSRSPVRVGGQWTPRVPKGLSLLALLSLLSLPSLLSLLALPSPKVFSLETAQSPPMPSAPAPRAGNAGTRSVRSATLLSTPHRPYSSLRPQAHTHHHPTYLTPKVCSRLALIRPDCWGQWASLPRAAHFALTPSSVPGPLVLPWGCGGLPAVIRSVPFFQRYQRPGRSGLHTLGSFLPQLSIPTGHVSFLPNPHPSQKAQRKEAMRAATGKPLSEEWGTELRRKFSG